MIMFKVIVFGYYLIACNSFIWQNKVDQIDWMLQPSHSIAILNLID